MLYTITDSGEDLIASSTNSPPVLDQFVLGTQFGYVALKTDTALRGSSVHVGSISSGFVQPNGLVKYVMVIPASTGSFSFGEVAVYSSGVLVAIGTSDQLVHKSVLAGASKGNEIVIDFYLSTSGTNYSAFAELGNSDSNGVIPVIGDVDNLPPATDLLTNLYVVTAPNDDGCVLAFASNGRWNLTGYDQSLGDLTVDFASHNYVSVTTPALAPSFQGELVLHFVDGPAAGSVRVINTYDPVTHTLGIQSLWPFPLPGNKVQISKKSANSPWLANFLSSLSPSLTAAMLNELVQSPLSGFVKTDGSVAMTGSLDLGGMRVRNSAAPTLPGDLVPKSYLESVLGNVSGSSVQILSGPPDSETPVLPKLAYNTVSQTLYVYSTTWTAVTGDVLSAVLTGFSTASGGTVVSTDTLLAALGKLQKQSTDLSTALNAHVVSNSNPHSVTKAQVGLGQVDNTSDAAKPLSTAAVDALSGKEPSVTPGQEGCTQYWGGDKVWHELNATAVGLWNVDNTADADKPVSTAAQGVFDDLGTRVSNLESTQGSNDSIQYTQLMDALSGKEPSVTPGQEGCTQYWGGDKVWHELNATAVGLWNVDNTADADKPVSTAAQGVFDDLGTRVSNLESTQGSNDSIQYTQLMDTMESLATQIDALASPEVVLPIALAKIDTEFVAGPAFSMPIKFSDMVIIDMDFSLGEAATTGDTILDVFFTYYGVTASILSTPLVIPAGDLSCVNPMASVIGETETLQNAPGSRLSGVFTSVGTGAKTPTLLLNWKKV